MGEESERRSPGEHSLLAAALRYAERGWHVFPVTVRWDEALGKKVSTFPGSWRVISTADPAAIERWFGPGGLYAHGHVAIDCGKSGLVVVDVDGPEGAKAWRRLAAEYRVSETASVRTPSGGMHYYFRAGATGLDGGDVTAALYRAGIDSSGKVAGHVDVRGDGGLVYAPPSADARGPYEWSGGEPSSTGQLARVPLFVCRAVPVKGSAASESPDDGPVTASVLEPGPFAPPARMFTAGEARRYVGEKLAAFREMRTPEDHGFNDALNALAVLYGHFVPEFVSASAAAHAMYAAAEANRSVEYQGAADVRATIRSGLRKGMSEPYARTPEVEVPDFTAPVSVGSAEVGQGGTVASATPTSELGPVEKLLARMVDSADLGELAYPEPLIDGVLDLSSESWIIGAPGGFKSFVALDWACHVATGTPWRGQGVKPGRVVYVVAEGKKSMRQRREAWSQVYELEPDRGQLHFLPEPVQVTDQMGWAVLVEACRRIGPALIVLDTQARITVGIEENSNGAMGALTEAVRRLKEATGACVLVVHHTGRNGEDARGASAIDGAQDTEMRVDRPKGEAERKLLTAVISTDKQKDGDESVTFEIVMRKVELGINPATGRPVTSLAIEPLNPFSAPLRRPDPDWIENLTENQGETLAAMREHSDTSGATKADLSRWIKERRAEYERPEMPRTSMDSAVRDLVAKELLTRKGARVVLTELLEED